MGIKISFHNKPPSIPPKNPFLPVDQKDSPLKPAPLNSDSLYTFFELIFIPGNRRTLHQQKSVSYGRILNIFSLNVKTLQMASFPIKEMKFLVGGVPANCSHG